MTTFKLTNDENFMLRDDGVLCRTELSCFQDFLQSGGIPLPADPIPNPAIAIIDAQLAEIDSKRIRPIAEGDTIFLATLNAQAIALRAERSLLPPTI